ARLAGSSGGCGGVGADRAGVPAGAVGRPPVSPWCLSSTSRRRREEQSVQPLQAGDPRSVGDYALVSRLGRGAMGTVYLGRSRGGRMVAVKLISAELADDPGFRERFRREVEMARSV